MPTNDCAELTACQVDHKNLMISIRELNAVIEKQIESVRRLEGIADRTIEHCGTTVDKLAAAINSQYLPLIQQASGIVPGGMVPMRTYLITTLVSFGVGNLSGSGMDALRLLMGQ